MKNLNYILVATIFIFLVGCGQLRWVNRSGNNSNFDKDNYACLQSSQRQVSGYETVPAPGGWANVPYTRVETNNQIFDACMASKGWSLQRFK